MALLQRPDVLHDATKVAGQHPIGRTAVRTEPGNRTRVFEAIAMAGIDCIALVPELFAGEASIVIGTALIIERGFILLSSLSHFTATRYRACVQVQPLARAYIEMTIDRGNIRQAAG